ncbi:MAG: CHC2 zinc finger domain-containing protein [Thermoanaerobaculaceae bacterium]|nr:CHC2 zinc finger domain-containing protein [Thermoanaerobaculaceae bacterium]
MHVSKDGIERIKASNALVEVVAERGIELRKKGKTLVGRCPFHEDKTPSFTVTPDKGLFHCFGCGASGDVIGFVTKHDQLSFGGALQALAHRAGLELGQELEPATVKARARVVASAREAAPREAAPRGAASSKAPRADAEPPRPLAAQALTALPEVVEHYHRSFCERKDAQAYLFGRGFTDLELLRVLKVGYADGSLLKLAPRGSQLRAELTALGVITAEGRELLGGCVVVPIPDPLTGSWTNLYGRGVKVARHCYLPGPLRGVLNFQAARLSEEVILAESVLDALSFLQAGIGTALPIYGTNGFGADLLDLLKRERVRRVILALDNDEPGRKATDSIKEKLTAAGLAVRVASLPAGIKDPNELLVSRNGDAAEAFRRLLDEAEPRPSLEPAPAEPEPKDEPAPKANLEPAALSAPAPPADASAAPAVPLARDVASAVAPGSAVPPPSTVSHADGQLLLQRDGRSYRARVYPALAGRLRATVRLEKGAAFHVDTLDLYSSRSRAEYARRAEKLAGVTPDLIEADLLALVVEAEKLADERTEDEPAPATMSESERAEALALLSRPDLLDQVARDVDALGYVGEETNKRLLYLVAVSRKLQDPLSAIVLSASGAGKSGITEVIERLTPPEDVVLLTRLTPQSLYYTEPGYLDQKLVIVEERYGSMEADYSIRVLQSRKKLIAAAPVKDPQTGNMRTRIFTVEARAAFIEATTATSVNHENATRCFELSMDESAEQTRKIHERQRLMKTNAGLALRQQADAIARRHWNAQRLLEPLAVVIPFADQLGFPSSWMRTRRDHARFLNLIEVSAFLHQHQRQREAGAIVATVADYAVAYALGAEVLAETLTDVRKPLRDAYARLQALASKGEGTLSRREIREALNLPDSTVRRWLSDLVELEYLAVVEAGAKGAGRTSRYRLVERAADQPVRLGLLTPDELRARIGR